MIRVLVVDDSAVFRKILQNELSKFDDIDVVGTAIDPYMARAEIIKLKPDVLTLDIEMPRMDGLSFLAKLMKHYPMPVVIVSSQAPENSDNAFRALELGAIEIVSKPGSQFSTPDVDRELARAIRAAASAKLVKPSASGIKPPAAPSAVQARYLHTTHKILAIGASTGGTTAIETLLQSLPITAPGTVIVQHMPPGFTAAFAERLNRVCQIEVREARNNDQVVPGLALISPGNTHMLLQRSGAVYGVCIKDGPAVHHQRPSVDVLFHSVARHAGRNAIGVLLTGMGMDGAKGLLAMREHGAYTIAQDKDSCVVFGMPKEAIALGAAEKVFPLTQISHKIIQKLSVPESQATRRPVVA